MDTSCSHNGPLPTSKRPRTSSSPQHHNQAEEKKNDIAVDDGDDGVHHDELPSIPTFELSYMKNMTSQEFIKIYNMYQAVHFKAENNKGRGEIHDVLDTSLDKHNNNNLTSKNATAVSWKDIGSIYKALDPNDKVSWCIENHEIKDSDKTTNQTSLYEKIPAERFLLPTIEGLPKEHERAYCSFLVQKDKKSYHDTLERLPMSNLHTIDEHWSYEPCLWIFFGRNSNCNENSTGTPPPCIPSPLEGRGLHTDSVSHDGTWHYQLSGTKEWFLSPTCDLLSHWEEEMAKHGNNKNTTTIELEKWNESTRIHVPCQKGDVIIVNTRLWFHQTIIPNQKCPSVSYARDFMLETITNNRSGEHSYSENSDEDDCNGGMTNLDGLYARNEIEGGTIIFTATDMPDCELHRSRDNPNCEVVELDDGTSAVVSRRTIACGEFFCIAESSDEEEFEECPDGEELVDDENGHGTAGE